MKYSVTMDQMLQKTPGPTTTNMILKLPKLLTKRIIEPEIFRKLEHNKN